MIMIYPNGFDISCVECNINIKQHGGGTKHMNAVIWPDDYLLANFSSLRKARKPLFAAALYSRVESIYYKQSSSIILRLLIVVNYYNTLRQ